MGSSLLRVDVVVALCVRGLRFAVGTSMGVVGPAVLVGLAGSGCSPAPGPSLVAHALVRPLSGPCPADQTAARGEFAAEVQTFAATLTGPEIPEPIVLNGSGPLVAEDVPAGPARVAAIFGLTNGLPTWRGVSLPFEVESGADVAVDVLLARVADVSCARSSSRSERVFHTATLLDDGQVLIVGGAGSISDAQATCGVGCRRAAATSAAAVYDPRTGVFTEVGSMAAPRMFHAAARLGDGRVVVAGGTGEALLRPVDAARYPFPIDPRTPLPTIEVYDPTTRTFSVGVEDPGGARVFAAAATTPDGSVIITGGIPGTDPSRHDLGNALATSTVCRTTRGFVCQVERPMARPRAGHSAFAISGPGAGVYLWGGSVDLDQVDGLDGYHLEVLRDGATSFELVDVASMQQTRNLFFAATAQYFDYRVMSAGGLLRDSVTGAFTLAQAERGGGPVYIFDRSSGTDGGIATGKDNATGQPAMETTEPLFLAGAAGLPNRRSAIVAGGFRNLSFEPTTTLERYEEQTPVLTISPILVGGEPRALREARGGLTTTAIGDGSVLFTGGLSGATTVLSTAEVYADISVPPQAAPLPSEGR